MLAENINKIQRLFGDYLSSISQKCIYIHMEANDIRVMNE